MNGCYTAIVAMVILTTSLGGVARSPVALGANRPQWPQCGYDPAASGQSPYVGPDVRRLKWIFLLDGWGCSPIVGADGTVYVGTNNGTLYAIGNDGSKKWSRRWPVAEMERPPGVSPQEWAERLALGQASVCEVSSCALGPDGTLYVAQRVKEDGRTEDRFLMALDERGEERWRYSVGQNDIVTKITVDTAGTLYFGTSGKHTAYYALRSPGRLTWSRGFSDGEAVSSAAVGRDNLIYVAGTRLRALDLQDGHIVHEYAEPIYSPGLEFGPVVGPDGTVYVASGVHSRNGHFLYAFNPDLTLKWRINAGVMEMTPAVSADGTVYIHNWGDVLGVTDGKAEIPPGVHAILPDGTVKWSLPGIMKAPPEAWDDNPRDAVLGSDSSPIVDANGVVYFGSDIGTIFAVRPDGTLSWQLNFGGEFDTRPALDAEGTLYICHAGGPGASRDLKPRCYAISARGRLSAEEFRASIDRESEADDPQARMARLRQELREAREANNQVEVQEIEALLERLESDREEEEEKTDELPEPRSQKDPAEQRDVPDSSGKYFGHRWRIDDDGLMWWDDKPYVRFAFTGNGDPGQMLRAGFDQFTLMPAEEWPISGPDLVMVRSVDETSDRLEKGGATYYANLNAFWPWRYGNLIAESDRAPVFVRDVQDVTRHAGRRTALDLQVRMPVHPAERDHAESVRTIVMLFDLQNGTIRDLSDRVEHVSAIHADPDSASRLRTDEGRVEVKGFRVRTRAVRFPTSDSLRLVVAMEMPLAELPGVNGLPALWKPGIQEFYRRSLEVFRPAYAKPRLRGLQFGDEINTFPQSLLTSRAYLDIRHDAVALKAYREWLARRFDCIEELNEQFGSAYTSFDEVRWRVPLHPFSPELADTDEAAEREESWARAGNAWGLAGTVEQLRNVSRVQDEFRIWLCGHWLAEYARMAKEVIGDVPVFVCSAAIGGDANQYLAMHRWALREGVDGLIRNHYGHGGREERHTLANLARWIAKVQQESGCTKHLWANEVGYVGPYVTDDDWAAKEAAELGSEGSFGSQWAFPSRESLREMLALLTRYGYRGFNRFLMNPSAQRASQEVKWMAQLRPEITSMVVQADGPPAAAEGLTREQAIVAARADHRVRPLLRGVESVRATAEFSERWDVWLVHFFAGDRPLGFASVSRQGEVLEVGGPEGQEREEESREEDGVGRPLTYRFPKTARIHIPDAANTATLMTCDLVAREPYRSQLHYQCVLVEDRDDWTLISHRSAVSNDPFPFVTVQAAGDSLLVTFHAARPESVQRASFATMDEAIADYQRWLEQAYGVGRIGRHPNKPQWLEDLRQVFTIDLCRPHGEITQSFEDVVGFLDELHQAGASEGVLLYLCGWSGPYDARYPEYRPAPELGGDEGFRWLVETAHRYGCRVMIHTCPVAFDPWLSSFLRFEDCALRGTDHPGGYRGWPGGYQRCGLDFDSGRRAVDGDTVLLRVPQACEARMTVGGFDAARPQVTVGDRTLGLPADASDPYTMPFTFFFDGETRIRFSSGPPGLWYRVHGARRFVHVWTYPFVAMDPKSARWREYFTAKVTGVVRGFGLDAVHLDAHPIGGSTWDCLPLFKQVMEALPGVAFSAEEGLGEVGLAVFGLTQGCRLGNDEMLPRSPVCAGLTAPYIRHYWHLVGARSFVPVGPVWNIDPPGEVTNRDRRQLRSDLQRAQQLGVIPTLRVNARRFGLDPATRSILQMEP